MSTPDHRYHICGAHLIDGVLEWELNDTRPRKAEAFARGRYILEHHYDVVDVYDSMAHKGRQNTWRISE